MLNNLSELSAADKRKNHQLRQYSMNFTLDGNGSLVPIYMLLLKSPSYQ